MNNESTARTRDVLASREVDMESVLREAIESSLNDVRLAATNETVVRAETPRRPESTPRPVSVKTPQSESATERRLKLIIESAPVSLMIADPSGRVLAANRAAMSLFAAERVDAIVGRDFSALIDGADSNSFAAFIGRVCTGTPGSIEYGVLSGDGRRRTLETHATPIRRGDREIVALLAATWDVTERNRATSALAELESKWAALESERNGLKEAADTARQEAAASEQRFTAERAEIEQSHQNVQQRMQATLEEAERRHENLATRWADEREALETRLREAVLKTTVLSDELAAEREKARTALNEAERAHEAALAELVKQRAADRDGSARVLRAERHRISQLLDERQNWRTTLEEILSESNKIGGRLQQLFDAGTNIRLVSSSAHGDQDVDVDAIEAHAPADNATAESTQEACWQF